MSCRFDEYIVLRTEGAQRKMRGGESHSRYTPPADVPVTLAVERLDGQRLAEVRHDPAVLQVTPPVPMKLIAPLAAAPTGAAWDGGGSSDAICRAILWAREKDAQVIALSLGMDFPGYAQELVRHGYPADLATSKALEGYRANTRLFDRLAGLALARNAFGRGVLIVAAAGNESRRDVLATYTISVSPPAAAEGVTAVAALEATRDAAHPFKVASFSNVGAQIAAPGVDILSAKAGGGYVSFSGTSMATPHVAGVAALWAEQLQKQHELLNGEILAARLTGCARHLPGLNMLDVGAGIVQAPTA